MSISRRSLALVLACGLALAVWMMSRVDAGPIDSSADLLGPFKQDASIGSPASGESASGFPSEESLGTDGSEGRVTGSPRISTGLLSTREGEIRWLSEVPADGESLQVLSGRITRVLQTPQWTADMDGDGQLNEADLTAFQDLWDWADAGADFNRDGVVDPFDFADFVLAYDQREQRPAPVTVFSASEFKTRLRMGEAKAGDVVSVEFQVQLDQPAR